MTVQLNSSDVTLARLSVTKSIVSPFWTAIGGGLVAAWLRMTSQAPMTPARVATMRPRTPSLSGCEWPRTPSMCSLPAAGAVQRRMAAWPASPGWPPVALSSAQPIVGSGSAAPPCQVSLAKWGRGWNWTVWAGSSTVPQPNCQVS